MASIERLNGTSSASPASAAAPRAPATAGSELAKLETQLSDWVHCPSCKTPAGKAKIAEITDKIDAIKAQVKTAEDAKAAAVRGHQAMESSKAAVPGVRFDGQGGWLKELA